MPRVPQELPWFAPLRGCDASVQQREPCSFKRLGFILSLRRDYVDSRWRRRLEIHVFPRLGQLHAELAGLIERDAQRRRDSATEVLAADGDHAGELNFPAAGDGRPAGGAADVHMARRGFHVQARR